MSFGDQNLPETVPVMVLGGATLFPCGYMPLFIFEPRYREMLAYALENDRLFCVGHARAGIDPDQSPDPVYPITTLGLIRACVTHDDGTSHLMLSGLQRVEITGWVRNRPFRIASIRPRPCHVSDPGAATEAALRLVDLTSKLCGKGQPVSEQLRNHLLCVKDPCAIADVVAQSFFTDPEERQRLLEIDDLVVRLEDLVGRLSSLLADGK